LKEALIDAALELIAQKGPAGFTFAEAARWAGVSPAAPYRHFRDRDELMADVARRGFDQFEAVLARAWEGGRPDAFTAFDRVGKAYLQFARSEPAYYSAMFEAGIPPEASPELREAGERAFAVLRSATERLVSTMPAQDRPPVLMMALHIWALSHGIASLFGRGDSARRALPMSAEDLLEAAVLIYLRGLGLTVPAGGGGSAQP
jgi:AcrR family transcriptional regulator